MESSPRKCQSPSSVGMPHRWQRKPGESTSPPESESGELRGRAGAGPCASGTVKGTRGMRRGDSSALSAAGPCPHKGHNPLFVLRTSASAYNSAPSSRSKGAGARLRSEVPLHAPGDNTGLGGGRIPQSPEQRFPHPLARGLPCILMRGGSGHAGAWGLGG